MLDLRNQSSLNLQRLGHHPVFDSMGPVVGSSEFHISSYRSWRRFSSLLTRLLSSLPTKLLPKSSMACKTIFAKLQPKQTCQKQFCLEKANFWQETAKMKWYIQVFHLRTVPTVSCRVSLRDLFLVTERSVCKKSNRGQHNQVGGKSREDGSKSLQR